MALCCIGGVCVPWSAVGPFLAYGLLWLLQKLVSWGVLPPAIQEKVEGLLGRRGPGVGCADKSCCPSDDKAATKPNGSSANISSGDVVEIVAEEEWENTLSSHDWVCVKFTAAWCKPCKAIQPFYEELAASNKKILFTVVDVDELDDVAGGHRVALMPTFILFNEGREVNRCAGSDKGKLRELVE